jgi:type II restriction/modification system DNA methylase subunit YeeA
MPLSVEEFVNRWKINALSERSGSQSHFIDLCIMLGQPHPAAADAIGERYTFEKPVSKVYGGKGFADVWLRDHFAWEYKGKHKDLKAAYKQLNDYREDLFSPPLLVVCDFEHFEIHTNFGKEKPRVYAFTLDDLKLNQVTATCPLPPLEVLRALFGDTDRLRPDRTDAFVTQEAAKLFAKLAERLEIEKRAHTDSPQATKEQIAHFLIRLLFCLFADSVDLLPDRVFRRLVEIDRFYPRRFLLKLPNLFAAMSLPDGIFGEHTIRYFNGGLFRPEDISVIQLDKQDMAVLYDVAHNYDWSHVAPAIFGTLFERSLNEARRSLIGAHYTSEEDILLLIEPVVMRPLQQRWAHVRDSILVSLGLPTTPILLSSRSAAEGSASLAPQPSQKGVIPTGASQSHRDAERRDPRISPLPLPVSPKSKRAANSLLTSNPEAERLLAAWFDELAAVRILDPACGSGNFLYVALRRLLDLWKESRDFAIHHNIQLAMQYAIEKMVSPSQLFGIETEFYAHELASIVVWIGFLQWKHEHGISEDREPILQKLDNIEHADAILRYAADNKSPEHPDGQPYEPTWPAADFIIGNPPFLGGKLLRRELGDKYVDDLFNLYKGRVKAESDLVVYWFEKARGILEAEDPLNMQQARVGLLATQGIRGGANRNVLERILRIGNIFWAWSDRKWTLEGAAVHVSMIGFERGAIPGMMHPLLREREEEEMYRRMHPGRDPLMRAAIDAMDQRRQDPMIRAAIENMEQRRQDPLTRAAIESRESMHRFEEEHRLPGVLTQLHAEAERALLLDGKPVLSINPDLTTGSNTASAQRLKENEGLSFQGPTKIGKFEIANSLAMQMMSLPLNPNGRPNTDVIKPWVNARDIMSRPRGMYIIDFGESMSDKDAALYQMPFEHIKAEVYPVRSRNKRERRAVRWWLHGETNPVMRKALAPLSRYIVTPRVSKFRVFVWQSGDTFPDSAICLVARQDDYFFGVLHSCIHELWARAQGTQLREVESGFRYTPNSTFDTFPFPWPPGTEPSESEDSRVKAIADAARSLVSLRDAWLNPPNASEDDLKDRTLTKLYNLRTAGKMAWLDNAHRALDQAVFAAYGWPSSLTTQQILANLLALNHQRAAPANPPH